MIAVPACIPVPRLAIWITKDRTGSRMWTAKPEMDHEMSLYIGEEAVAIDPAFTNDWILNSCRRIEIRQPGKFF